MRSAMKTGSPTGTERTHAPEYMHQPGHDNCRNGIDHEQSGTEQSTARKIYDSLQCREQVFSCPGFPDTEMPQLYHRLYS